MSAMFTALRLVAKPHGGKRAQLAVGSPNANGAIIPRMSPVWLSSARRPNSGGSRWRACPHVF